MKSVLISLVVLASTSLFSTESSDEQCYYDTYSIISGKPMDLIKEQVANIKKALTMHEDIRIVDVTYVPAEQSDIDMNESTIHFILNNKAAVEKARDICLKTSFNSLNSQPK